MTEPARLSLAHLPTPLEQATRLGEAMGLDLWIKRDDASGGPEAGNKIRKLEYLLADALEKGSDCVITCGGIQSNHARATAVLAARLGLDAKLMLRDRHLEDDDGGRGRPLEARPEGNLLLDRMVGAEVRRIVPATYGARHEAMAAWAERLRAEGRKPYVIPEGGSNGLGAMGYVRAMAEVKAQCSETFDVVVHACGSGGTAAGVILGAAQHEVADRALVMAVCDDAAHFTRRIEGLLDEAQAIDPSLDRRVAWEVDDSAKGPAYAVTTEAQRADMIEAGRLSGLVTDPVYSGKALHGLWRRCRGGDLQGARVLFIHTGGLPGLLAEAAVFEDQL